MQENQTAVPFRYLDAQQRNWVRETHPELNVEEWSWNVRQKEGPGLTIGVTSVEHIGVASGPLKR